MEAMPTPEMPMQATKEHLTAIGELWSEFAKAKMDTFEEKIPASMKAYIPYFKEKADDTTATEAPPEPGA